MTTMRISMIGIEGTYVRAPDGTIQMYRLRVLRTDTVDSIKSKIQELVGVPAGMQILLVNGKQLETDDQLRTYMNTIMSVAILVNITE